MASQKKTAASSNPNRALLNQVNRARSWFHARKTRPIWAREAKRRQTLQSLEGPVEAKKGDFVCRGIAGEKWVQAAESLKKKYRATDRVDSRNWRKYLPRKDAAGVMAARVPRAFTVVAAWGTLKGKRNDFLVKHHDDRNVDYPDDVWIVDQALFESTYEAVDTGPGGRENS